MVPLRKISSTKDTPEIILNPDGNIKITGRSLKAEPFELSTVVSEWIETYLSDPAEETRVEISLEYINTLNVRTYISLLKKMERAKVNGSRCVVYWYYEEGDDDILEKGEYVSLFVDVPFNFIIKPDTPSN